MSKLIPKYLLGTDAITLDLLKKYFNSYSFDKSSGYPSYSLNYINYNSPITKFEYDPDWNKLDINNSKLVNYWDFGDPWERGTINLKTGRRSGPPNLTRAETIDLENSDYYKRMSDSIFDKDNFKITPIGLIWAKEVDKLNKGAEKTQILTYDSNGNEKTDLNGNPILNIRHDFLNSKNLYGVSGENYTSYNHVKANRNDNIARSLHNGLYFTKDYHFLKNPDGTYTPIKVNLDFNKDAPHFSSLDYRTKRNEKLPYEHSETGLPYDYNVYIYDLNGNIINDPNFNPSLFDNLKIGDPTKSAVLSLGVPEVDYTKLDQDYLDSLKGLKPKILEQTSPIDVESPLYKWAKEYGLDPTNPKVKKLYEYINNNKQKNTPQIDPYVLKGLRVFIDNLFNTLNTENLIKNLDVALKSGTPIGRQVHGDYIAQLLAQREAARLINRSPLTSNAQIQSAVDLEAIQKGNQIIEGGNLRDAQVYWNTAEAAWQQAKENTLKADDYANFNRAALAEFNNKIALMRWDTNRQNMQNWDTFAAEKEQELAQRKQYEQYRNLQRGEAYEDWYNDNYGVDSAAYQEALYKYRNAETKEERDVAEAELQELNRRISLQRQYNRFKQYGWDTSILENNWKTKYKFDNGIVTPLKLGGRLLQKGGGFGVQYTPSGSFSPYELLLKGTRSSRDTSSSSEKKSSSSEDDKEEKEITQLRKNIAETIKGIDGLDSDVNILSKELIDFFDYTKYSLDDDPTVFYSMYVKALTRVNQVKQSAKQFDLSFKELEKNNALNTPAVTSNGGVIVGVGGTAEMEVVSVNDYLTNTDKYHLLTNGELLELRRKNPNMAFSDKYLTAAAQNGTSLQAIEKYVKDFIGGLGKDEESRDVLTRQFGAQGVQGLQTLQLLIQGGLTNQETAQIAASLNALGEYNVSSSSQINQVKQALASIFSFMPPNMRTLLSLYSGGEENSLKAILGLITKGVSSKIEFKINGFTGLDETGLLKSGSSKSGSGSGSGGSSNEPLKDLTLVSVIRGIGGTPDRIKLNEGTKSELGVDVKNYQIPGGYESGSLSSILAETKLMGITDPRKIYFGDLNIPSENLRDIAYLGRGFSRVMLPVTNDGSPDFSILSRFDEACLNVRKAGLDPFGDGKERLAKELQNNGLYSLLNGNLPNMSKFGLFLITEGLTSSKSGIKLSKYVYQNDDLASRLESILSNKNSSGKVTEEYELDKFSIYNPFDWGSNYDLVFEGTIYIPINNNELLADIASGNKLKDSDALSLEREYLSITKRSNFKDRTEE